MKLLAILLVRVRGPVDWVHRTEDLHVACMTALLTLVVVFLAWIRKMPQVTVVA